MTAPTGATINGFSLSGAFCDASNTAVPLPAEMTGLPLSVAVHTGTGSITSGSTTTTLAGGAFTFTDVKYSQAETGVVLRVTAEGMPMNISGDTAAFNVGGLCLLMVLPLGFLSSFVLSVRLCLRFRFRFPFRVSFLVPHMKMCDCRNEMAFFIRNAFSVIYSLCLLLFA